LRQIYRENIKFERALEEKELEVAELKADINDKIGMINNAGDETIKLEAIIRQKNGRIE